jgi:hypothetical protein
MLAQHQERLAAQDPSLSAADCTLKPLLDHIASELAGEYVRLMETAAAESNALNDGTKQI